FLRVIELTEAFYLIASHRDNRMAENLLNEVEKRRLDLCFLIAGGFHSEGLARNLSLAEQPYFVIAPAIESLPEDEKELYGRRLSGHSRITANSVWKRYFGAGDGVIPAFIQMVKAVQKEGAAAVFNPLMIQASTASVPTDRFIDEEMSFSELTAGIPVFGRSEVRAIPQVELRSDDSTVIDFMNTAYDQFQRFVADPQWRADKKLILVLGHTRPDTDAVFSSISRAYLKSLELRHANHETTIVVPMINTLNANEKSELEKFRGDVLYYLTDVMRFDLDRVLFFHEAADALRQLEPSKLEIYLTDHNQLVKEQKHWALRVREILDHHDVNKLAQIREHYPSAEIAIEEIGSSSTLAAGIISNPPEMREDLAKLLLAGLISDTSNLTDPDPAKVTDKDRKVAETLRQRAGGQEVADRIYEQMNDRYDTITGLTDAEALQKDFKDYRVTVGGKQNTYSISSLRIGRAKEEEFGQREFAITNALKQMSADQGYSVSLLNIGYRDAYPAGDTSAAKNQARLYIVSRDANAARDLADLLAGTVQGLVNAKRQDLPENVIQLSYKDETLSRRKLTPVINVFSAVSKEDYYASRVKSIYAGVEVKSRPVIPYNEWVDLVLRHEKGKEGIFRNYEVLKERGQIDYAQKEPVDYRDVQEDVQESEEGKKAIENGEVMIMRPFGGTGGRAFGYKIPARYRIRGLYIPMLKFMLGENLRYISAWEMVFAHARYLLRHYRTTHLGIMSATNKDQHNIFETDLKEKKYYGLNPENVLIYPVAGIPSLNPSLGDL
ncbi:MAG TPA: DHH family phosphoesterase, partial [bacterium]|nr:DHH family phosphoesterase [bacterium]